MEKSISIHITEDHELYTAGILSLIKEIKFPIYFTISKTIQATFVQLRTSPPDLILLDLNLPDGNGIDVLDFIINSKLKTKVIVFSMHYEKSYLNLIRKRGAHGYVPKNLDKDHLLRAIKTVLEDETYFVELDNTIKKPIHNPLLLSTREIEIVNFIIQGLSNSEISVQLSISLHTVKSHKRNIFEKLEVNNVYKLVEICKQLKLV